MTSPRTSHNGRMLGNVRLGNKSTLFPPLTKTLNDSNKAFFQEHHLMIQGDALSTPPKAPEEIVSPRLVTSTRPLTSRSDPSSKPELKDLQAKDKQHRNRIQSLQKLIDQLRAEVKSKEEELTSTQARLQKIEEHYKSLYEEEKEAHDRTREELEATKQELKEKTIYAEQLKVQHERQVVDINAAHEQRLSVLRAEKDKEICDRDAKIEKMKKQMADVLKDNSWERQQQLEELTKELNKISDEAAALRIRCKNMSSKSKSCDNCSAMKAELEKKTKRLAESEVTIQQLNALCKKFETQLKQQDVLLKEFAVSKGFKTDYDPKK
ncbi:tax1-binding protein 1 homolog [Acanthaster planci]|uniref:Tax1-binding protein 1 homolog n=1 Tax=Acanthaster planci TaxID=133434 RepID=A0A8B7XYA8_ACAPL|nr:tax1-binding protein 1 homolog [Acanthaster planci]XP_022085883.1 tax1-binding protein 1 homolog [Acanthaster planci]